VSAANDFAANKALTVPDCRGRVRAGKDDMGGSTASRLTVAGGSFDGTVMGKAGGIQAHALSEAELATHAHAPGNHLHTGPSHTHGIGNHTHDITHTHPDVQPGNKSGVDASGTMFYYNTTTGTTASQSAANTSVAGSGTSSAAATGAEGTGNTSTPSAVNTGNIGSNTAHLNVQPTIVFTAIIKL
jgi:microcystin-dependent protein